MFNDSKFTKRYNEFIEARRNRPKQPGMHSHHIIPKSMGGSNRLSNLVNLTPREHFHVHLLLIKMTEGEHRKSMAFALKRFGGKHAGKSFALASAYLSAAFSGAGNPFFGKKHSVESKQKFSGQNHGMYGKYCYDLWVEEYGVERANELNKEMLFKRAQSLSGENNPMYGTKHTDEWRKAHSEGMSGEKHFNYGKPAFTKKRLWMNNQSISKMIKPDQIDQHLREGWIIGRLPKKSKPTLLD